MIAGQYLTSLDKYSEVDFARKVNVATWSLGQMYGHLVVGTRFYHLKQITQCLDEDGTMDGKKKLPGTLSFLLGSFPPVRIKVPPSETYTPKQPKSIEAMKSSLESLIVAMREVEQKVASSTSRHKTHHPAFGYLSAREWFQLIEMHFRHHLRQQRRLEQLFAVRISG